MEDIIIWQFLYKVFFYLCISVIITAAFIFWLGLDKKNG
jgi:hypothetical protein